jgi:hypothetical protein
MLVRCFIWDEKIGKWIFVAPCDLSDYTTDSQISATTDTQICLQHSINTFVIFVQKMCVYRVRFPVVSLDYSVTYSFRPHHGPGVKSAPSENEYQEGFLGETAADAWGWQSHYFHVPNFMKIWEPKPPGTLWATPGLLRESFTLLKNE